MDDENKCRSMLLPVLLNNLPPILKASKLASC
jgi:hypothetical protein